MFYYLYLWLEKMQYHITGMGVLKYISFRAALAIFVSLLITMFFGKRIISLIQKMQVGETVRDLGLDGQKQKAGTPTMGGLIILAAIIIPIYILF